MALFLIKNFLSVIIEGLKIEKYAFGKPVLKNAKVPLLLPSLRAERL